MDLGYVNRSRNTDQLDFAAELQDEFNKRGVEEVRKALEAEQHPGFDGVHCVEDDCGTAIPQARLAMGKVRCVDCQTRKEKRR
jgi:RNA polymerase-binding transcription factor DksA